MGIYILNILVVFSLLKISKLLKEGNILKKILVILAILIPSIIAGIRYNVGTDFALVYQPYFQALKFGYSNFHVGRIEIGYEILNRIIIFFNGNINIVMFIASLITNSFMYLGLKKYEYKIDISISMTAYLFLFYQATFNVVRQYISAAIIFYAMCYFGKNNFKYILLVLFATLFHKTSLLFIIIMPLLNIIEDSNKSKINMIIAFFILMITININLIYEIMSRISFLAYYSNYLKTKPLVFSIGMIVRVLPILIISSLYMKKIKKDKDIYLIYNLSIYSFIFRLLAYNTINFGERISWYFLIYNIILIGYLYKINKRNPFIRILLIIYMVVLWDYEYFILNAHDTAKYMTFINK